MKRTTKGLAVAGAALAVGAAVAGRKRRGRLGVAQLSRTSRNIELARLGAAVGATYATTAARKVFASAERREALDHERELHGRRTQLHGGLGVRILSAIDDIGPVNKLRQIRRLVAELLPGHGRYKQSAGFVGRIV